MWGRPALDGFAHLRLSNPGDSESFEFYLAWNLHAIGTGSNPFFTPNLYAPDGLDLGNAISVPTVSLLVAPVTLLFGGTAGYNVAFLLSIFLAGAAVTALARELTGSAAGSLLAGLLTVVSPYFAGHALSHLNLMWVAGLPFLAYVTVRLARGTLGRAWFVGWVALTVAFTVGASTELLVTQTVFGAIAWLVALVVIPAAVRGRWAATLPWLALGGVIGGTLGSPAILAALRSGVPEQVANDPTLYASDLTNVLAPTQNTLIGDSFFQTLRAGWLGNQAENTAYIPVTLLVVALVVVVLFHRDRVVRGVVAFAVLAFLCSLGPLLTIAGAQTIPLPWELATLVPGLDHALPGRFSAFVFMGVALLVATGWAHLRRRGRGVLLAAALTSCALLVPNLQLMLFPTDASLPSYVTSGQLDRDVDDGENVLVLPAGQWGPGMRWMQYLDFSFEMPAGNGGGAEPPPMLQEPMGQALFSRDLDFDYENQLLPYLERVGVDLVLVDDQQPQWRRVMERVLPGGGVHEDGAWVYRLP